MCLGIISNRNRVLTLNFSPLVPSPHTLTHFWVGEGIAGEGKTAEMSHGEREREIEMRRDTKRDCYRRDRERNTYTHTQTHPVLPIQRMESVSKSHS